MFEEDAEQGQIASTVSLVRALDWLISSGVDVVNISLAGPPNRLLETALQRAAQSNVTILAAAGNGGPVAAPMYPAAYASVVAVTAVDARGQVFRLANRVIVMNFGCKIAEGTSDEVLAEKEVKEAYFGSEEVFDYV